MTRTLPLASQKVIRLLVTDSLSELLGHFLDITNMQVKLLGYLPMGHSLATSGVSTLPIFSVVDGVIHAYSAV